jgi:Transglycosylase SLT domain
MNKVNLILLIIAMFTGFPAIVAVSQNVTVTTPSEAYISKSSVKAVQSISSNFLPLQLLSSSVQSSSSSSIISSSSILTSSSSVTVSSFEVKPKVIEIEAPKIIGVRPISSAVKVMQDIKRPEPIKEAPKPEPKLVIKQEIKTESKIASLSEELKPVAKTVEIKPIVVSSSSLIASSSSTEKKSIINLTFAQQIIARCEILGCNATQMIRIMQCESSGNPTIVGAGLYIGLFQFLPSTFNAYKIKAGLPNGDIYNGSDQIHVATYMFANGQSSQWGCQ